MAFSTVVVSATLAIILCNTSAQLDLNRAKDALYQICWFEYLKVLPVANPSQFVHCATTARKLSYQFMGGTTNPKTCLLTALSNNTIPEEYTKACRKFAEDPDLIGDHNMAYWTNFLSLHGLGHDSYYISVKADGINDFLVRELDPLHNPKIRGRVKSTLLGSINPVIGPLDSINPISGADLSGKNSAGLIQPYLESTSEFEREVIERGITNFDLFIESFLSDSPLPLSDSDLDFTVKSASIIDKMLKFPFSGFISCLMNKLETRHGKNAVEDLVAEERIFSTGTFGYLMFVRDNEFRERHGVKPFSPKRELVEGAQTWADQMALECNVSNSAPNSRLLDGEQVGENVAGGEGIPDPTRDILRTLGGSGEDLLDEKPKDIEISYLASNGWYDEIKNYPFPHSYKVGQQLEGNISHFTQTVWKKTEYVGYGYAYNETCKKWFIAARYYPAGNIQSDEEYKENVLPPVKWTHELKPLEIQKD